VLELSRCLFLTPLCKIRLTSCYLLSTVYFQEGETNRCSGDDPYGLFLDIDYRIDLYKKQGISAVHGEFGWMEDGPLALL
jgi:hypothetical protein